MMDNIFFRSEDGGISWFSEESPKTNEKQRKTIKNQCFSFVFIDFDKKSWNGTIFGLKKSKNPSSQKKTFFDNVLKLSENSLSKWFATT